jgi:hypothetical protein
VHDLAYLAHAPELLTGPNPSSLFERSERELEPLSRGYTIDGAGAMESMRRGTSTGARTVV